MTMTILYLYVRIYTINLRVIESDSELSNAKQDLLIQAISLEEHGTAYPSVFSGDCVTRSIALCVCFVDRSFPFVHFLLTIV